MGLFFLFCLLFRASGTVYTAMDVATGQEVSATRIPVVDFGLCPKSSS